MDYQDFFGFEYLSRLTGKKSTELFAVFHFLKNEGQVGLAKDNFVVNSDEPADIIYSGRKFQVTDGSPDYSATFGKLDKNTISSNGNVNGEWTDIGGKRHKILKSTFNLDAELDDLIMRPLKSKSAGYGDSRNPSFNDVELLIFSFHHPIPEFQIEKLPNFLQKHEKYFESRGYSRIHLADQKNSILVYS